MSMPVAPTMHAPNSIPSAQPQPSDTITTTEHIDMDTDSQHLLSDMESINTDPPPDYITHDSPLYHMTQ